MSTRKTISEFGRDAAERKAKSTHACVRDAQRKMVAEIERNRGVYPNANGRVSAAEVLRRAGLDRGLLQKPIHHTLRNEINDWVKDLKQRMISGKNVRKAVTERAETAEEKTDQIYQLWATAELEYVEQTRRVAELELRCAEMRRVINELRKRLGE